VRYLFLAVFLFIYTTNLAQQNRKSVKYKEPSSKEIIQNQIACECLFSNKYNKAQRLSFYPFNKAKSVKLISFKMGQNIPVKNRSIIKKQIIEQLTLDNEQIDSLTSLFYNVNFTPVKNIKPHSLGPNCYEPRNGILFLNSKGKVIAYLEICFGCERTIKSSKIVRDGEYCSTKYNLLRSFFSTAGIKYGTSKYQPILTYKDIFKLDTTKAIGEIENKIEKKTKNGKDISALNDTEQILFFTINANQIYDGFEKLSGIGLFYLYNSGNFYQQTLTALKLINAYKTLNVLEQSKLQWPEGKIPENLIQRRELLIKIINNANPQWDKLEKELFNYKEEAGAEILIPKEDLTNLILKFALLHQDELKD
jgi:Domain of unknown function (DUF4375)